MSEAKVSNNARQPLHLSLVLIAPPLSSTFSRSTLAPPLFCSFSVPRSRPRPRSRSSSRTLTLPRSSRLYSLLVSILVNLPPPLQCGHPIVPHSLHHPCCHALVASSSLPRLRCPTLVASSSLPYPRCTILPQLVISSPITLLALINRLCRCSYVLTSGSAALINHRGGCRTPNPLANFCR